MNKHATRQNILAAIAKLTRNAHPRDAVIIYFAGHGANYYAVPNTSHDSHYYLFPWDMALKGKPKEATQSAIREAETTLISDVDLQQALAPLDVDYGALILDTCYSGQALEGAELHGPLSVKGLAGLAYEKGLNLLAASQPSEPTTETIEFRSSVLVHALVYEGINNLQADWSPKDGWIELKEWLIYGASHVAAKNRQQQARLALSRIKNKELLVLEVAAQQP